MTHPKLVLLIKFRPTLPLDKVKEVANAQADEFRVLSGLTQKYYLHDKASGEIAGLYLWERASIAAACHAEGAPRVEVMDVIMPLREGRL